MSDLAFYVDLGQDAFEPTKATVGPWDPGLQHGGPVAALLTSVLERGARPGARIGHFALEFLGPVPLAPMRVTTEVVRPGKKIELLGATVTVGDRPLLRATAWRLAIEPGRCPDVNTGERPPPLPADAVVPRFPGVPAFGYGEALEWRFVSGGFDTLGASTAWSRLKVSVVQGETVSPLARAMAMVDSANGISAELDVRRFLFVPVNLTVSIARSPEGEWMGMNARTVIASEGTGTTSAKLFDERGYFAEALQTLFVEPRGG